MWALPGMRFCGATLAVLGSKALAVPYPMDQSSRAFTTCLLPPQLPSIRSRKAHTLLGGIWVESFFYLISHVIFKIIQLQPCLFCLISFML